MSDFMLIAKDFNLKYTIESGQPLTFYSNYAPGRRSDALNYITEKCFVDLEFNKASGRIRCRPNECARPAAESDIEKRLGLDQDIRKVYKAIGTDKFMGDAINGLYGMRITKNEPWEATLCFVVSQFNNIKRIRRIMLNLIDRFGEADSQGRHLFPTPESISVADIGEIRGCGTGFRDKYIKHVAEEFSSGFDAQKLYRLSYPEAKEKLMELNGIGDKVADCILLFGYNKFDAFPIDTWVKRVMERIYFKGRKRSISRLHEFSTELWGEYRGYAQQYIFEWGRRNKIR